MFYYQKEFKFIDVRIILILLMFLMYSFAFGQITHTTTHINISGAQTGDALRTYIAANSLGTIEDRTTIMKRSLNLATNASFTDNNATWVYPDAFHMDFTATNNPLLIDLEDVAIIYTGGAKGHTTQPRAQTLRLVNVQYRIESTGIRSDFFNFRDSGFDFSNVQFMAFNTDSFLHLPTSGGLLENVSVVASDMAAFQPDCNPGETLIMRNWTLDSRINGIIPNGGGNLTAVTRLENLTWPKNVWGISGLTRGQTYIVVNPNKPVGWTGYQGVKNGVSDTYEVHTYNLKIVDENNNPIPSFKTQLRRSNGTTLIFDLLTDVNGDIAEQEVVTYEQTSSNVWQQNSNFLFAGIDYNHDIVSGVKALQNGRVDEVVLSKTDEKITEPSKAVVDAYTGIVIDHASKKITISENKNLCEVYDFAKANKVDNLQFPTPSTLTVATQNSSLLFNDYILEITGTAVLSPCDKFTKVISTVNASLNNPNVNLNVALTDATNTYKLIQIKNIVSANVVVTDENTNTILAQYTNYTGEVNLATQSSSNNVSIVVRRNNYSNWAVNFDLTTADEFLFTVNQSSVVVVSALLSKQDMLIYLLQKVLQKNQAIQSVLNNNALPTINLNTINQGTVEYASEEKQDEMIEVLKRILAKTQAIRKVTDN